MPRRRKKRKRRRKVKRKKWKPSRCANKKKDIRAGWCVALSGNKPPWQVCRFCDSQFKSKTPSIKRAVLLYLMGKHDEAKREAILLRLEEKEDLDEVPF